MSILVGTSVRTVTVPVWMRNIICPEEVFVYVIAGEKCGFAFLLQGLYFIVSDPNITAFF